MNIIARSTSRYESFRFQLAVESKKLSEHVLNKVYINYYDFDWCPVGRIRLILGTRFILP